MSSCSGRIRRTVRSSLETTDDACGFAWLQFLREQPDRDQNWRGWLYRVAQRDAWRLNALDWKERDHTSTWTASSSSSPIRTTATTSGSASMPRCKSPRFCRRRCNAWS